MTQANQNAAQIVSREDATEMLVTYARDVQLQPRTLLITRPALFYFEPLPALRQNDSGNAHDQINKGCHQADSHRPVGHCAMMPDVALARATGNAYERDYLAAGERCRTSAAWLISIEAAHAIYQHLFASGEAGATYKATCDAIVAKFAGRLSVSKARKIVRSVLRDLRCYGLASLSALVLEDETRATLVSPADVLTLAEYEAQAAALASDISAEQPSGDAPAEQPSGEANGDAPAGEYASAEAAKASKAAKRNAARRAARAAKKAA